MSNATLTVSDAPFEGLADKIGLIRDYYRSSFKYPAVRRFAEKAAMGDDGRPSVANMFTYLKTHMRWMGDPVGVELIKAPWVLVSDINNQGWAAGDCDDQASLAYTLLRLVGVKADLAVAWYDDNVNPTHIFVVLPAADGGSIPFDLSAPKLGVTRERGLKLVASYG